MRSILLHIGNDTGLEARIQASLDLARAFDAHLTCLHSVNLPIFAPGDIYGSALAVSLPAIEEAAAHLRKKVEGDLANEDVKWEWREYNGPVEYRLLEQSALNDVIVLGASDVADEDDGPSRLAGELLARARTPVLVIPKALKRLDCSGPALVAWNGSTEASNALRSALPLLQRASSVILGSVAESSKRKRYDLPPTQGAEYLSRHGVDCEMVEIPQGGGSISETLFTLAASRGCAYMVMGAYGHSRLAEMFLGGVTREALTAPKLPVFMAH
jgi:nucleotide-binding universal stress UspA family protein